MSKPLTPHYATAGLVFDRAGSIILDAGPTVPSDNAIGYATGCLFMDTNAAAGSQWFINEGTAAAADFNGALPAVGSLAALTATVAELNGLDADLASNILTRGAGVDTAESYATGITRVGGIIHTRIVLDLSTLIGSGTDLHIIGESGAASCHWGQYTVAKMGTLIGGLMTCLELPAGGADDIDLYSASVSTGTQAVAMTDAALGTEVALISSGTGWTSGLQKGMTSLPNADDFLYLASGEAAGGTYSAGKFLIEFFGV